MEKIEIKNGFVVFFDGAGYYAKDQRYNGMIWEWVFTNDINDALVYSIFKPANTRAFYGCGTDREAVVDGVMKKTKITGCKIIKVKTTTKISIESGETVPTLFDITDYIKKG